LLDHVILNPGYRRNTKKYPTVNNEIIYKRYRNKLKQIIIKAQKTFYAKKIKLCMGNIKQIWEVLNGLLNKPKHSETSLNFELNGNKITDPKK